VSQVTIDGTVHTGLCRALERVYTVQCTIEEESQDVGTVMMSIQYFVKK